jgi:hypothetical protein
MNVRDCLHVEDHCRGVEAGLVKGVAGETYNIGGEELANLLVIDRICAGPGDGRIPRPCAALSRCTGSAGQVDIRTEDFRHRSQGLRQALRHRRDGGAKRPGVCRTARFRKRSVADAALVSRQGGGVAADVSALASDPFLQSVSCSASTEQYWPSDRTGENGAELELSEIMISTSAPRGVFLQLSPCFPVCFGDPTPNSIDLLCIAALRGCVFSDRGYELGRV